MRYTFLISRHNFIMERIFSDLFEPSAPLSNGYETQIQDKKYSSRLTVTKTTVKDTGNDFFTVRVKESVIANIPLRNALSEQICDILEKLLKKYKLNTQDKCLVIGLGNEKVTADSLGSRVVDGLYVTGHLYGERFVRKNYGNLTAFKSSVSGLTGIDSNNVIKGLIATEKPAYIVAVDTLACSASANMGTVAQISDNGIQPGGGVNNPKPKLDYASLGIPVFAVGVPLVIYVDKLICECIVSGKVDIPDHLKTLVVAPKEIDFLVEEYSAAIADGINTFMRVDAI